MNKHSLPIEIDHLAYFDDTYRTDLKTHILDYGIDDTGTYLIPKQTIFHPKGGGQPDDQGYIKIGNQEVTVTGLVKKNGFILHYINLDKACEPLLSPNVNIHLYINRATRIKHAKYHTCGHLIAHIIEKKYPDLHGVKGNHFPDQASVTFSIKKQSEQIEREDYQKFDLKEMQNFLENRIKQYINSDLNSDLNIIIGEENGRRTIKLEDFLPLKCGGTHLKKTSDIKHVMISKIKFKKNEGIKISYII